jgi:FlaG protein
MDVTAIPAHAPPGPQDVAGMRPRGAAHDVTVAERFADQVAAAAGSGATHRARPHPSLPERTRPEKLLVSEIPISYDAPRIAAPSTGGDLKLSDGSADVLARFAFYEGSNRVVVTMYDRDTGEVIRELPPRQVLDMMAALAGRGLTIDVTT